MPVGGEVGSRRGCGGRGRGLLAEHRRFSNDPGTGPETAGGVPAGGPGRGRRWSARGMCAPGSVSACPGQQAHGLRLQGRLRAPARPPRPLPRMPRRLGGLGSRRGLCFPFMGGDRGPSGSECLCVQVQETSQASRVELGVRGVSLGGGHVLQLTYLWVPPSLFFVW